MFKSKLFSPLRFHIKALRNKESALDELEENTDLISFAPVILSLSTMILAITLLPMFKVAIGIIGVLSILSLLYHGAVTSIFRADLSRRNHERIKALEEEEENRRRKLRREKARIEREKMEDILRKLREDEYKKEQQARENWERNYSHTYSYQQEIVDKNMVNAMKLMGLKDNFTQKDLKSAYRKLSKVHHPDMGGLEVNFKKLNKAYNYILDRI